MHFCLAGSEDCQSSLGSDSAGPHLQFPRLMHQARNRHRFGIMYSTRLRRPVCGILASNRYARLRFAQYGDLWYGDHITNPSPTGMAGLSGSTRRTRDRCGRTGPLIGELLHLQLTHGGIPDDQSNDSAPIATTRINTRPLPRTVTQAILADALVAASA